jgi:hypothetical protein
MSGSDVSSITYWLEDRYFDIFSMLHRGDLARNTRGEGCIFVNFLSVQAVNIMSDAVKQIRLNNMKKPDRSIKIWARSS